MLGGQPEPAHVFGIVFGSAVADGIKGTETALYVFKQMKFIENSKLQIA